MLAALSVPGGVGGRVGPDAGLRIAVKRYRSALAEYLLPACVPVSCKSHVSLCGSGEPPGLGAVRRAKLRRGKKGLAKVEHLGNSEGVETALFTGLPGMQPALIRRVLYFRPYRSPTDTKKRLADSRRTRHHRGCAEAAPISTDYGPKLPARVIVS